MPAGGYGMKGLAGETATTLKRRPAEGGRVSYNNTRRTPRTKPGNGKLGTLKALPRP
jgi:hypothetical protein